MSTTTETQSDLQNFYSEVIDLCVTKLQQFASSRIDVDKMINGVIKTSLWVGTNNSLVMSSGTHPEIQSYRKALLFISLTIMNYIEEELNVDLQADEYFGIDVLYSGFKCFGVHENMIPNVVLGEVTEIKELINSIRIDKQTIGYVLNYFDLDSYQKLYGGALVKVGNYVDSSRRRRSSLTDH